MLNGECRRHLYLNSRFTIHHSPFEALPMTPRRPGLVIWASGTLLAFFSLMALFAPFVAPYDYAAQNRAFPNCPPSRLRINPPNRWAESILYTHPMVLADPLTRRYDERVDERIPVRLFSFWHLFT